MSTTIPTSSRGPGSLFTEDKSDADPRVTVFRAWLAAHDRRDMRATSRAVKELRLLGVSVAPKTIGG
jgi:hypothetical protein